MADQADPVEWEGGEDVEVLAEQAQLTEQLDWPAMAAMVETAARVETATTRAA
jgi:hypothetical protein